MTLRKLSTSITVTKGKGTQMADINDIEHFKWVFVRKWGKVFVAPEEKPGWIFNFSPTPREYWKYIEELDVWRSNVSAL